MNKLERSFRDQVLEPAYVRGDLVTYHREAIKLRLAGRTHYTADFAVWVSGEPFCPPALWLVEVKGGWFRDDAKVKTKIAASMYPHIRWLVVKRERIAGWLCYPVDSRGISPDSVYIDWIHGR